MSDLCRQCREELGFAGVDFIDFKASPYDTFLVVCEGCGTTTIDRAGNCLGNHSFTKIVHKEKD